MQINLLYLMEVYKVKLNNLYPDLITHLLSGEFQEFENKLYEYCTDLYNQIALIIVASTIQSPELKQVARIIGQKKGLAELRKKEIKIQLKTGYIIKFFSWYASRAQSKNKKQQKRGPNGSGCYPLLEYWGCIQKASPGYYSYICMLCVICPSFDVVLKILEDQKIAAEYNRVKKIAYAVGNKSFLNRIKIGLKPGENVNGKRVIISIDGGRTRMREQNPDKKPSKTNKGKREKFDTPWREPKLFVIHILEQDGSISKNTLPIYDAIISGDDDKVAADCVFELLTDYLKELKIDEAIEVLFIADGADWIWNRVQSTLLKLGVTKDKITEAVDYYHAVEHVSDIIVKLRLGTKKKKALFKELKKLLWDGKLEQFISKVTEIAKGRQIILDKLNYFHKHINKMKYDQLRENKLPCGSGIVESAIRRIINLRFKSPSTFWICENVEKLIFLRAIFLADRWNVLINNLIKSNLYPLQMNLKLVIN
jgi:hypothetical protein